MIFKKLGAVNGCLYFSSINLNISPFVFFSQRMAKVFQCLREYIKKNQPMNLETYIMVFRVSYKDLDDFLYWKSIENVYFQIRKSIENAFPLMRNPLKILFQNWKSIENFIQKWEIHWKFCSKIGNPMKFKYPKQEIH